MKSINAKSVHQSTGKMEVYMFNVGQGDHSMIRLPNGEYGIIDFFYSSALNMPEPPCLTYFKELKRVLPKAAFEKITIAFFCISHTDKDHIKGAAKAIEWFYENGVFIKEFWLGAARSEAQMMQALKVRIPDLIKKEPKENKKDLLKNIDLYNNSLEKFFRYLKLWQNKLFNGPRYRTEPTGKGEYLADIRSIKILCNEHKIRAINMGPLGFHLDKYYDDLTFDIIKIILGDQARAVTDKNQMSHILRLSYDQTNLLFGGDTHKDIWRECLDQYLNNCYEHKELHGSFDSSFIKVSHHGSHNSSCQSIWKEIISPGCCVLGISAGQHKKFGHPHAETLMHIRAVEKENSQIFATNICSSCIQNMAVEKEIHEWYDDAITNCKSRDISVTNVHRLLRVTGDIASEQQSFGLLAYIFEIPNKKKECVKVRMALSRKVKKVNCFYQEHEEKLHPECYKRPTC